MPLKSRAQVRKWAELTRQGKISPTKFKEAVHATDFSKIPERVKGRALSKVGKVKTVKVIK